MPKSNLIRDVEEIANRISRRNIKESRAILQLGTWVKTLFDEIKEVKQRLDEIDIKVKKINTHGATMLTPEEAEKQTPPAPAVRVKPGELKQYRTSRRLSQAAVGALLGVTQQKYARWEAGKSVMIAAIEKKFREVQGLTGTVLRTRLQGLGFFQATGKRTRFLRGPAKSATPPASAPVPASAPPPAVPPSPKKKAATPQIVTKGQIHELRLKLGYTQRQMADLLGCKFKNFSNWEYGVCRPPQEIVRKLLPLYNEHVAGIAAPVPAESASASSYSRPFSKRKIYESEQLPVAKIRAGRAASGLTIKEVAERLGVPVTTYQNWEYGNAKPSPQYIEQLIRIFGTPPTASVKAATKASSGKGLRKTRHEDGYPIPSDELRAFRRKIGLSASQMAILLGIERNRYKNWEHRGRGVPPDFVSAVKILQSLSRAKLQKRFKEAGIVVPANPADVKGKQTPR